MVKRFLLITLLCCIVFGIIQKEEQRIELENKRFTSITGYLTEYLYLSTKAFQEKNNRPAIGIKELNLDSFFVKSRAISQIASQYKINIIYQYNDESISFTDENKRLTCDYYYCPHRKKRFVGICFLDNKYLKSTF